MTKKKYVVYRATRGYSGDPPWPSPSHIVSAHETYRDADGARSRANREARAAGGDALHGIHAVSDEEWTGIEAAVGAEVANGA